MKVDPRYISAEYLNDSWDVAHFTEVAQRLERAKVTFACSATSQSYLTCRNLSQHQAKFLSKLQDSNMRESTLDLITCEQFRRDFFVKGATHLSPEQRQAKLDQFGFILRITQNQVDYSTKDKDGNPLFPMETIAPLVDFLSDYKVRSINQIVSELMEQVELAKQEQVLLDQGELSCEQRIICLKRNLTPEKIREAVFTLIFMGKMCPALFPDSQEYLDKLQICKEFNRKLISDSRFNELCNFASPVLQGGFGIERTIKPVLQAHLLEPEASEERLVEIIKQQIKTNNIKLPNLSKSTSDLETMLKKMVHEFKTHALAMFNGLQLF